MLAIADLPALSTADARLPATYESAKTALANCASIDECLTWANKAEALASYARMADDDTLRKLCDRIQARAVRRCGELLKQVNGQGARTDQLGGGDPIKLTQRQVAEQAGLSKDRQVTAVRVANVPAEIFEAAVESDTPPTVTRLADMGRKPRAPVAAKAGGTGGYATGGVLPRGFQWLGTGPIEMVRFRKPITFGRVVNVGGGGAGAPACSFSLHDHGLRDACGAGCPARHTDDPCDPWQEAA